MTKSPAKWIKRVLFGKKSKSRASRKHAVHKATEDYSWVDGKEPPSPSVASPIISNPLCLTSSTSIAFGSEKNLSRALPMEAPSVFQGSTDKQGHVSVCESKYSGRYIEVQKSDVTFREVRGGEEQAATKIQAIFKGYRARKALRVLEGIIKLQALIRGNLVRRQASATLFCICGIIRLQAMARGQKVKLLETGIGVFKTSTEDVKNSTILQEKDLHSNSNKFVLKFFSSMRATKPLQMIYTEGEPNSHWTWLERWTSSHFWKIIPQPKKVAASKLKVRLGSHDRQAGSGISKHNVRKVSPVKPNTGSKTSTSQSDRKKHLHTVHEQQTEHLKVAKKNPKKGITLVRKTDQPDSKTERMAPKHAVEVVMITEIDDPVNDHCDSVEDVIESFASQDQQPKPLPVATSVASPYHSPSRPSTVSTYHVETIRKPHVDILTQHESESDFLVETIPDLVSETILEVSSTSHLDEVGMVEGFSNDHNNFLELNSQHQKSTDEDHLQINGLTSSNKEHFQKNLPAIKTKAFLAEKLKIESKQQSPLPLRSYMASTASAKAKLHGQGSSKVSPGLVEKNGNGFTNRRALSPSNNGKLGHRHGQPTVKGGVKNDQAFSSSKDKNDKLIQAEWRR